jgi:hypothetical protein
MPHSQQRGRRMEWTGMRRLCFSPACCHAWLGPWTCGYTTNTHCTCSIKSAVCASSSLPPCGPAGTGPEGVNPTLQSIFQSQVPIRKSAFISWAAPTEPSNLAFHTVSLSSESESSTTKQPRNSHCDGAVSAVSLPPAPNLGRPRL